MQLPDTIADAQEHVRKCRDTLLQAENAWAQRVNVELADLRKAAQDAEEHLYSLLHLIPAQWKDYV